MPNCYRNATSSVLLLAVFGLALASPALPAFGVVAGLAVVFLPGIAAVRWISRHDEAPLPRRDRMILSGLLGSLALAFAATLSFLVSQGHALLITRLTLGAIAAGLFGLDLFTNGGQLRKRETSATAARGTRPHRLQRFCTLAIVLLLVTMLAAAGIRRDTERYTELFLVSSGIKPCGWAQTAGDVACVEVGVAIRSHEQATMEYTVAFRVSSGEQVIRSFTLTQGQEHVEAARFPLSSCEDDVRIYLYRADVENPYRYLRLSCTAAE